MAEKYKLPPGVKKAWTQALRSGEYAQAEGYLKASGGYCCLGVLAECAGELVGGKYRGFSGTLGSGACNPDDQAIPAETQSELVRLNDESNKSFEEIATWIERNL